MIDDFFGTIESEAVPGLSLDEFVDKVGAFKAPTDWDIVPLYLNLLGEDVVTDLLPTLADVGSLAMLMK